MSDKPNSYGICKSFIVCETVRFTVVVSPITSTVEVGVGPSNPIVLRLRQRSVNESMLKSFVLPVPILRTSTYDDTIDASIYSPVRHKSSVWLWVLQVP